MSMPLHERLTCGCDNITFHIQRIFDVTNTSYYIYCTKCGGYVASISPYAINRPEVKTE